MSVRFRMALLAVGGLAGLNPAFGQCPHDGPATAPAAGRVVVLEARWVTVPEGFCEEVLGQAKASPEGCRMLSERDLPRFLHAVQCERRANVLQAPRLSVTDGETGTVWVGEQTPFVTAVKTARVRDNVVLVPQTESVETGVRLSVTPTVSADGESVRLKIDAERKALGECKLVPVTTFVSPVVEGGYTGGPIPFTQYVQMPRVTAHAIKTTAVIPVGGAVLLARAVETREERTECGVPVLRELPYLGDLFKNVRVTRVSQRTLLIVSASQVIESPTAVQPPRPVPAWQPGPYPIGVQPPALVPYPAWQSGPYPILPAPAARFPDATPVPQPAAPSPATKLAVVWQNTVSHLPDPTKDGKMSPGLVGTAFLFREGPSGPAYTWAEGTLTVDLHDLTDGRNVRLERWEFDAATLTRLVTKDEKFGVGYALFLPWPTYSPKFTQVKLTAEFKPLKGPPLHAPATTVTLQPKPTPTATASAPVTVPAPPLRVVTAGSAEATPEARKVAALVKAYHLACAAGEKDAATRYAVQALALDPTCFSPAK